jgi:hydrogenase-4 component B
MSPVPFLIAAALLLCAGILTGRIAPRVWLSTTVAGAAAALMAAIPILLGSPEWNWRSELLIGGEALHLRLDGVSALFLALLGIVGGAGTVYARSYWTDRAHPRSAPAGRAWWSAVLLCIGLVLLSSNGLHFLIAWELFTLSSYFLITLDRQRSAVRAAGWLYLAASHAATLGLFAFFACLAARTSSWDLGPMRENAALAPLFWLALFAFGLKAGMFPLHIWLPSAHANAPSHVSALMSGVTIKMGIYGLVRFTGWLPTPALGGWVVAALGVASAVLGVAYALGQHDIKRLLAYHSVENIGIILIGLGFALIAAEHGDLRWGSLALAGALLHVWNHGVFKALLFLGAGSVLHATGTREMSRLGGLWRRMPWTTGLFALGAMAIAGLPPLNGFVSEWLVYMGLFGAMNPGGSAALAAIVAALLLAATGALALACFVKVCGVVFLGAARSQAAAEAHESGLLMRGPMLLLAGICAAIGLFPIVFWPAVSRATRQWNPNWSDVVAPGSLAAIGSFHVALTLALFLAAWLVWQRVQRAGVRRALTWDCGYAAPTARMQYTAGSFAGIINEWFAWILRPVRHDQRDDGPFPRAASCDVHTPETVLEFVLAPISAGVMQVAKAARGLQHGRLQAYLLYLVLGIAALALVALTGGPQ